MDSDYFYKFEATPIDADLSDRIAKLTIEHCKLFHAYRSRATGKTDNNWVLTRGPLLDIVQIRELINSCNLTCFPLVLRHFPNVTVPIHVDDPNKRNTVLIFPIRPKSNYVPTVFYERDEHDQMVPVSTCSFSDGLPALLNTQKFHGLTNNNNLRINFQLCFNEPFELVRDLAINQKLFKSKLFLNTTDT